jgi:hypothetical protein
MLLEALLRGGPFGRVVFAITNAERTMVEGRLGLGDGVDELLRHFRVSTRAVPVAAALDSRRVVFRPAAQSLTNDESRWCTAVGARSFGVAPLVVDARLVGCLYADCADECAVGDTSAASYLDAVAALASRAIASRRSGEGSEPVETRSPSDRADIVLRVLRGESVDAVAAECGVPPSEIEEWRRLFLDAATKGLG